MKRSGLLFALIPGLFFLTACSRLLQVTLFNNTGEEIGVRAELEKDTIAPNRFARFKYPSEGANRVFRLSSKACEFLYEFPSEISDYKIEMKFERGIQVQVEKDFSVNLLPVAYAGEAPVSSSLFLQREGFPLRPVSRTCR